MFTGMDIGLHWVIDYGYNLLRPGLLSWLLVGRTPDWGITPTGCAHYGCLLSRLLNDAAESADAMDSGVLFHSMMVRVANEDLNSLVCDMSVSSFLELVSLPRAGRFE